MSVLFFYPHVACQILEMAILHDTILWKAQSHVSKLHVTCKSKKY